MQLITIFTLVLYSVLPVLPVLGLVVRPGPVRGIDAGLGPHLPARAPVVIPAVRRVLPPGTPLPPGVTATGPDPFPTGGTPTSAITTTSSSPLVTFTLPTLSTMPSCIRTWCLNNTEMCLYNAGVTGWDPNRGPVPGITATPIGPCTDVPPQPTSTILPTTTWP